MKNQHLKKIFRENKEKFDIFIEVASNLNKEFNIKPILYGSLGLNLSIKKFVKCEDIDLLIPDKYISKNWGDLIELMNNLGFKLINEKEHEFIRNKEIIAFGKFSGLSDYAGIKEQDLQSLDVNKVFFLLPTIRQYLKIYEQAKNDKYRKKQGKSKSDEEKLKMIKNFLKNHQQKDI